MADHTSPIEEPTEGPAEDVNAISRSAPSGARGATARRSRWRVALLLLPVVVAIAAMGLAFGEFYLQYRPDQQTGDAAAHEAVRAASDGTVALLSYSADSLDDDFANAKSHLTGDFLDYYNQFTAQVVKSAAHQKQLTTTARVLRAAVSELHPDSAVVLVFVNQKTVGKDKPEPLTTASSVLVTLTKVKGSWLIEKFDPV